jgi:uncharacterized membrane protein
MQSWLVNAWRHVFLVGATVAGVSALVGTSMISAGHLVGASLTAIGALGLAVTGRLGAIAWWPTRRVFQGLALWVGLGWAVLEWARWWSGSVSTWDLGFYGDLYASIALRGSFHSTIIGVHALSDHFTPGLALLAPLYWWVPSILWLPAAKHAGTLLGGWLLYRLSLDVLGPASPRRWALPCLWLVHTVLAFAMTFQFQPVTLAPALVLAAFLAARRERWWLLAASLLLLMTLKENMLLVWVSVGLYLVVERGRHRVGVWIAALGIASGLLIYVFAMPAFSDGARLLQQSRFHPFAFPLEKVLCVTVCLASVGLLPLLRPRALVWALPIFGAQLATGFPQMLSFRFHYFAVPITVLFVAALHGLAAIEHEQGVWARLGGRARALVAAGIIALLVGLNGMLPHYPARLRWPNEASRARVRSLQAYRAEIPRGEVVFASTRDGPYLIPAPRLRSLDAQRWLDPLMTNEPHRVLLREAAEGSGLAEPKYRALRIAMERGGAAERYRRVAAPEGFVAWRSAGE